MLNGDKVDVSFVFIEGDKRGMYCMGGFSYYYSGLDME